MISENMLNDIKFVALNFFSMIINRLHISKKKKVKVKNLSATVKRYNMLIH